LLDIGQQVTELPDLPGGLVVEVENVRDLVQGEAESLAAQDQLQPDPVPVGEDPCRALALGAQQAAVEVTRVGDRLIARGDLPGEWTLRWNRGPSVTGTSGELVLPLP